MEKCLLIFPTPPETQKNNIKCLGWLISSFEIIHIIRQNHVSRVSISALHWTNSADFKEECDLWQVPHIPRPWLETGNMEPEIKEVLLPMGSSHASVRRLLEGQQIRGFSEAPLFCHQGRWTIKTCLLPVFLFILLCFVPISSLCGIIFIDPFCHLQKTIAVGRLSYKSG